jgi:hypothetical protein
VAALRWLDSLNDQAYAQGQFPKEDPHWDPNDDQDYQWLEWYQEASLRGMKESLSQLAKTLGPSYYCLYSLFNKIKDKGRIVSAW